MRSWCNGAGPGWLLVVVLLSCLRRVNCDQFNISLSYTTNVVLDVHLGDRVTIFCPSSRYVNIIYLRTIEQLNQCNTSVTTSGSQSILPSYINVGACAGGAIESFNIDIHRTSEFLATSVPFQNGGTYYFTSFTDGSAVSAVMRPTAGGDCTRGLSLIFKVIDPNLIVTSTLSTVVITPTPPLTVLIDPPVQVSSSFTDDPSPLGLDSSASSVHISIATTLFTLLVFVL